MVKHENYIREQLKQWFSEDFLIDQIMEEIAVYKQYSNTISKNERDSLLAELKNLTEVLKTKLGQLKRLHEHPYSRIEGWSDFYIQHKKLGNAGTVDLYDYICSLDAAIHFTKSENEDSPQPNMVRQEKEEAKFYRTINHHKYYRLYTELEAIWLIKKKPIVKSADGEFMKFLSLCSRGSEEYSGTVKTEYSRMREKAVYKPED